MSATPALVDTRTHADGTVRLHHTAISRVTELITAIEPEQWKLPTPCRDWDVRALVDHLITEARWTPPLLAGRRPDEVGSTLDQPLDSDPVLAWTTAQHAARAAADRQTTGHAIVHVSAGDIPAHEYLHQVTADYLVHGWDLAVTIGRDETLDPELVDAVAGWLPSWATAYQDAGMIAAPVSATSDDAQTGLLAAFGRSRTAEATRAAIARFGAAFDRCDVDAVMAAMTTDCVFESTSPPDGQRHEGQAAVRQAWTELFAASGSAVFETEELIVCGERAVARWRYTWAPGPDGHVRGIDIFEVRDGLIAEKLSYVKG